MSENKCARCGAEKPEAEGWCALCLAWRRNSRRDENADSLRARIVQLEWALKRIAEWCEDAEAQESTLDNLDVAIMLKAYIVDVREAARAALAGGDHE